MAENSRGIWIFAEQHRGRLSPVVPELLTKAAELKAVCGEEITAVLLGSGVEALSRELIACGADRVLIGESAGLAEYSGRPYQKAMVQLSQKYRPTMILYGSTDVGRDLAPRVMAGLRTGLTADAVDLGFDGEGVFCQTTPGYGGKLMARIAIPTARPQMVTVRAGVFAAREPDGSRQGTVIREALDVEPDPCYEVLGTEEKQSGGKAIEEAAVLVSGGRGVRDEKDLALLRELAELLGGQVAGSRPLASSGLLGPGTQIGQSGKTVQPELIVNVAVSGSVQYRAGMQKAGCIVSVNKAEQAPIFGISHYGAVADYRSFLPAVIREIRRRKSAEKQA